MEVFKILAINPGSTSTKIAVFENEELVYSKSIRHEYSELCGYSKVAFQFEFRKDLILKELSSQSIALSDFSAIVGRGGLLKPISSGVYEVNEAMVNDLYLGRQGEHASNLGGLIAAEIAKEINAERFNPEAVAGRLSPEAVARRLNLEGATGRPNLEGTTGRLSPEAATGRLNPEAAAGRLSPEAATGRLSPEAAAGRLNPEATAGRLNLEGAVGRPNPESATGRLSPEATAGRLNLEGAVGEARVCKAYIADPVVVDELLPVARIAGHPAFQRISIFHALNQKAVAKNYAREVNKSYQELNLIVAHLGGGVSVGAHCKGKVVDVNNALDGEGPFSPERSGTLPAGALAKLCFSGAYTLEQIRKMIVGEGGMVAHLGTNQFITVYEWVNEGRSDAKLIVDAMAYNIAKSIGAMAVALRGAVDAILITGGMAHEKPFVEDIRKQVLFIAPVIVYPGEDELAALAMNGLAVLRGEEAPKVYV